MINKNLINPHAHYCIMAIGLGYQRAGQIQKGRNFAISLREQQEFDAHLRQEQLRRIGPLSKKITKEAKKAVPQIVAFLREEFRARRMNADEVGMEQLRKLDEVIVNRLPLPKETKKIALQKLGYEAVLTDLYAKAIFQQPINRNSVVNALEEAIFTAQQITTPLNKKRLDEGINLKALEQVRDKLKRETSPNIRITLPLALQLKLINSLAVRETLGEEMSELYRIAYSQAKITLASEMMKM